MGDKSKTLKLAIVCVAAAIAGIMAAAVASAQGPGDYQPTTTLPAPPDNHVDLRIETDNKQKLKAYVKVKALCGSESCAATATGKLTIRRPSQQHGKNGTRARRFTLKKDVEDVPAMDEETLKLKIPKKAQKQARNAIYQDGDWAQANVRVFAIDTAGNSDTKKTKIKLTK